MDSETLLRFGEYHLDPRTLELTDAERPVALPRTPARLLHLLVSNANRLVTREQITDHIWPDVTVTPASIATAVRIVRKTLASMEPHHAIETRRGQGYVFVGRVEHARRACPPPSGTAAPDGGGHDSLAGSRPIAGAPLDPHPDTFEGGHDGAAAAREEPAPADDWPRARITAHHLKRLHPDTRRVVDAAAVVGPAVHAKVVRAITGLSRERLRHALAEATRLGIFQAGERAGDRAEAGAEERADARVRADEAIRFAAAETRRAVDAAIDPERRAELEAERAHRVVARVVDDE